MAKVLFVTTDISAVAGVGRSLADLLENVERGRIDPVVVCAGSLGRRPTVIPRIEALNVPVFVRALGTWLPSPRVWGPRHLLRLLWSVRARVWSISSLIQRYSIDVVYTNGVSCIDGALAAWRTGRPHVWHIREPVQHNQDLGRYLPVTAVVATVRRLSKCVIVNSAFLEREFSEGKRDDLVTVVHNGVDIDALSRDASANRAAALRAALSVPPQGRLIVAVGTVNRQKGYDTFAKAASTVLKTRPNAVFAIAGAPINEHAASLRQLAHELGISGRFHLLGTREDVPDLLAACDIMVHSARREAFGRVIVEAMALAKPVVATRCGGPEEIVVDGETGFLVPVDDAPALAEKMVKLLDDSGLATRMGQRGRQRAIEHFSVRTYSARIAEIIGGLAHSTRCPNPGDL